MHRFSTERAPKEYHILPRRKAANREPVEPHHAINLYRTTLSSCLLVLLLASSPARSQTGAYTLNSGSATQTGQTYAGALADQSAVCVLNSGHLTLNNCTMTKTGDASNVNNSSQYGINAGVLAASAGSVEIVGGTVTTSASGGNGLFATGSGSAVIMSDGTISASGGGAHGVDATYGGSITLTNVDVTTTGSNSSALATDFGGGTVMVTGGTIQAASTVAGSYSAGIYSTGTISVTDATVSSLADCGGVIDGANTILLTNTSLTGSIGGIRLWKTAPAQGNATVTINGGSLTATAGDAFNITGSTGNGAAGVITLKGGAAITASTNNIMNVDKSSSATLALDGETLSGNLVTDETSSLTVSLKNSTVLTGTIKAAALSIDATSSWTLTANSYVTSLSDPSGISGASVTNITGNGFNVYYDASLAANSALGGKTYALVNGGSLMPKGATSVEQADETVPTTFVLCQNYPNPFNPITRIKYTIAGNRGEGSGVSNVSLVVYDMLGREVAMLVNEQQASGVYQATFGGTSLASGVYIYQLRPGGKVMTKRMVLQKKFPRRSHPFRFLWRRASRDHPPAPSRRRKRDPRSMHQSTRASCNAAQKPCWRKKGIFVVTMATNISMINGIAASCV
jgi:hypothetical protein